MTGLFLSLGGARLEIGPSLLAVMPSVSYAWVSDTYLLRHSLVNRV